MHRTTFVAVALLSLSIPGSLASAQKGGGGGGGGGGGDHTQVTPDFGQGSAATSSTNNSVIFTIANTHAFMEEAYDVTCTPAGLVASCTPTVSYVVVPAGGAVQVSVTYTAGDGWGSGTATLRAVSWYVPLCEEPGQPDCLPDEDTGQYTISVSPAPSIGNFWMNSPGRRDFGMCFMSCFAAVYAHSTVPYVSMDTPRGVTLVYNSNGVTLKPFVWQTIRPSAPAYPPSEYQLKVKVNGAFVTFLNGEQMLRFAYAGSSPRRIGGQFDASSYGAGVHAVEMHLTSVYPGGVKTGVGSLPLVVADERNSDVARGWTVAGHQRLMEQANGSVLIREGDGSYTYFQKVGSAFIRPDGDFTRLTLSAGYYTRHYADSTRVEFDEIHRMAVVRDPFGNVTSFGYPPFSGRLSSITENGRTISLNYGTNGISSICDPWNRCTTFSVNGSKDLTQITDPDSYATTLWYSNNGRLDSLRNRRNEVTRYGWNATAGLVTSATSPAVDVYESGSVQSMTLTATFTPWQTDGVPYQATAGTPFAPVPPESVGTVVTRPDGVEISYGPFDRHGQPALIRLPYGNVFAVGYNDDGQPTSITDPFGPDASFAYDTSGFMTYSSVDGIVRQWRNGGWGKADSTWGDGAASRAFFNASNGRTDSVRTAGFVTRYTYDAQGRVRNVTDPSSHLVRRATYAGTNGNRSKDSVPGGRVTTYGYDTYGRLTTATPPAQPTQTLAYDNLNRVTTVSDGVNPSPTTTTYDALYAIKVTDPKGTQYDFTYDASGAMTSRRDPTTGLWEYYKHGKNRELLRYTNRRGQHVNYAYDDLLRRTGRWGDNLLADTLGYSADGSIVHGISQIYPGTRLSVDTLWLNERRQPDSVRVGRVFYGPSIDLRYTYTPEGQRNVLTIAGGPGGFLARQSSYHSVSQLLFGVKFGADWTTIMRDNDQLPTTITLPGTNHTIDQDFTGVHSMQSQTSPGMGVLQYHVDEGKRIDQRADVVADELRRYQYDDLGRLTAAEEWSDPICLNIPFYGWACGDGVHQSTRTFSYDQIGNRTDLGAAYAGNRLTAFDGCTYGYDNDGNVTSRSCPGETVTFYLGCPQSPDGGDSERRDQ